MKSITLTDFELKILRNLEEGKTDRETARDLHTNTRYIEFAKDRLAEKLGLERNRVAAIIAKAIRYECEQVIKEREQVIKDQEVLIQTLQRELSQINSENHTAPGRERG